MKSVRVFALFCAVICTLMAASAVADDASKGNAKTAAVVIDAAKYPNLQAAFDAVPEAGGLVKLPPGEFKITKPLVISTANTRVEGAGTATHIINCNKEGKPALIIQSPLVKKNPRAGLWRVQLADFRIDGDPNSIVDKSTDPKSGDGILAVNIDEIYIHGMTVDHNGGHGINLVHCTEDPRVSDSVMTYNKKAGLNVIAAHDLIVSANHFEENQDAVRFIDGFNLCMTGNNIDDHLRHGIVIENTYGSVVSGNMIEECKGVGVILDRNCYGITISANVIPHNDSGAIDLRDAWGCSVSGNTMPLMRKRALAVGPKSGRITITGNNFGDSYIGQYTLPNGKKSDGSVKRLRPTQNDSSGIILEGTSDIVISGNGFSGLDTPAIRADANCKRLMISGNVVVGVCRKEKPGTPALDLQGAKDCVVKDNIISDGPKVVAPK